VDENPQIDIKTENTDVLNHANRVAKGKFFQ